MILSGELAPDSVVSQMDVARRLGVSRTPVREALRMLQEQGLISARPNCRATVIGIKADALEGLYCRRTLLESLGALITVPAMSPAEIDELENAQHRSAQARLGGDFQRWVMANRDFHRRLVMHAGADLGKEIAANGERSEFYQYLYCEKQGFADWFARPEIDHIELVAAFRARKAAWAARIVAQHLAKTALVLLEEFAPAHDPVRLRTALKMAMAGAAEADGNTGSTAPVLAPSQPRTIPAPRARAGRAKASRPKAKRSRR